MRQEGASDFTRNDPDFSKELRMRSERGIAKTMFEWAVHAATVGGAAALAVTVLANPSAFEDLTHKDGPNGAGLVENLTVIVLLPSIAAAIYAWFRWRHRLPVWWLKHWLLMWVLACVYFAGEECSWGQWFFGWETPEPLAQVNDQHETNLHNMSSWLDQKPRAMVEAFIIVAGLVLPVTARLGSRSATNRTRAMHWLLAPPLCWSAAMVFLALRVCGHIRDEPFKSFGTSEVLELATAWFLSLYLLSYPLRLSEHRVSA